MPTVRTENLDRQGSPQDGPPTTRRRSRRWRQLDENRESDRANCPAGREPGGRGRPESLAFHDVRHESLVFHDVGAERNADEETDDGDDEEPEASTKPTMMERRGTPAARRRRPGTIHLTTWAPPITTVTTASTAHPVAEATANAQTPLAIQTSTLPAVRAPRRRRCRLRWPRQPPRSQPRSKVLMEVHDRLVGPLVEVHGRHGRRDVDGRDAVLRRRWGSGRVWVARPRRARGGRCRGTGSNTRCPARHRCRVAGSRGVRVWTIHARGGHRPSERRVRRAGFHGHRDCWSRKLDW